MPQLMRMVLNESLRALKMRGWEDRWVLVAGAEGHLCVCRVVSLEDWVHVMSALYKDGSSSA